MRHLSPLPRPPFPPRDVFIIFTRKWHFSPRVSDIKGELWSFVTCAFCGVCAITRTLKIAIKKITLQCLRSRKMRCDNFSSRFASQKNYMSISDGKLTVLNPNKRYTILTFHLLSISCWEAARVKVLYVMSLLIQICLPHLIRSVDLGLIYQPTHKITHNFGFIST